MWPLVTPWNPNHPLESLWHTVHRETYFSSDASRILKLVCAFHRLGQRNLGPIFAEHDDLAGYTDIGHGFALQRIAFKGQRRIQPDKCLQFFFRHKDLIFPAKSNDVVQFYRVFKSFKTDFFGCPGVNDGSNFIIGTGADQNLTANGVRLDAIGKVDRSCQPHHRPPAFANRYCRPPLLRY